jgi:hypothetical protein
MGNKLIKYISIVFLSISALSLVFYFRSIEQFMFKEIIEGILLILTVVPIFIIVFSWHEERSDNNFSKGLKIFLIFIFVVIISVLTYLFLLSSKGLH